MPELEIEDRDIAFLLFGRIVNGQVPPAFKTSWIVDQGWFGIIGRQNANRGLYFLRQFGVIELTSFAMLLAKEATVDGDALWRCLPSRFWKIPDPIAP